MKNVRFQASHVSAGAMAIALVAAAAPQSALAQNTSGDDEAAQQDDASEEGEIVVTGTRRLVENFVNNKRENEAIVDSISADELGSLPAQNVAEALKKLPAVLSIPDVGITDLNAITTSEDRFVAVRGIRPDLNVTLLNGLNLGIPNQSGRSNFLDFFPVNLAERLEVVKTFSAENVGGAIGGIINVVPRSGFDHPDGLLTVAGSVRFDQNTDSVADRDLPFDISANFAQPLTDTIAIAASANYNFRNITLSRRDNQGRVFFNDDGSRAGIAFNNTIGDAPGNGLPVPIVNRPISGATETERYGGAVKIDFKPDAGTNIWLLGSYSASDQRVVSSFSDINLQIFCFGFVGCSTTAANQTPTTGTISASSANPDNIIVSNQTALSNNFSELYAFQGGLTRELTDRLTFDLTVGWSRASQEQEDLSIIFQQPSSTGVTFNYDFSDNLNPTYSVANPGVTFDPATYAFRRASVLALDLQEDVFDINAVFDYNASHEDYGFGFKAGARYTRNERKFFEYFDRFDATAAGAAGLTLNGVLSPISGQQLDIPGPVTPDYTSLFGDPAAVRAAVLPLLGQSTGEFGGFRFQGDGTNVTRTVLSNLVNDYGLTEDLYAGFALAQYRGDRFYANIGVRYERTKNQGSGFLITPNGQDLDDTSNLLAPTTNSGSRGFWLPSVQLNYDVTDDLKLRAAYSRSLGRPSFFDLAPRGDRLTLSESSPANPNDPILRTASLSIANPDIRPRQSNNFDLALEYYLDGGSGLLGVGLLYKDITDEIFTRSTDPKIAQILSPSTGQLEQFILTTTQVLNAESAKIYGVEFNLAKDFSFLPGPFFENMGIQANVTFVDGDFSLLRPTLDGTGKETPGFVPQQPTEIYNATLYYSDDTFDLNVSWSRVGDYVVAFFADAPQNDVFQAAREQIDVRFNWNVSDRFQVSLSGNNLLSEDILLTSADPGRNTQSTLRQRISVGRSFTAGVNISF